jgi:hypothetical protein
MRESVTSTLEQASESSRLRARRPLTTFDRFVRAPLGLLWLALMALLAVPVIIYMTALYYVVQASRLLVQGRSRGTNGANH